MGHGQIFVSAGSRKQGAQSIIVRMQADRELEEKTKRKGGKWRLYPGKYANNHTVPSLKNQAAI